MNLLTPVSAPASQLSVLVSAAGERAQTRFWEFFAANIRNKHTRRAYAQATREFLAWCESAGVASIADVTPLHVAAYIEQLGRERSDGIDLPHDACRVLAIVGLSEVTSYTELTDMAVLSDSQSGLRRADQRAFDKGIRAPADFAGRSD